MLETPPYSTFSFKKRIWSVVFFFAYITCFVVGIELYRAPAILSPAPGLALAGLALGGIGLWPLVFLGTLLVYIFRGLPFLTLLIFPFAHTLQVIIGVYLLRKLKFGLKLERFRDMLVLIVTSISVSVIVPTIGFVIRNINPGFLTQRATTLTWGTWWTGTMLSLLILSPLIIGWARKETIVRTGRQNIELGLAFASLFLVNYFLFFTKTGQIGNVSLVYVMLVPLMWISLRFGSRFATLALFITSAYALSALYFGPNAPAPELIGARLFQMEIFLVIISLLFLILAAIDDERKLAIRKLESHVVKLEEAVGMRDEFISVASHELKTPVTTLKIYSQVMKQALERKGEDPLVIQVAKMDRQLNKLVALVEDLLNVSRSHMGKLELNKEEFDLNDLVREAIDDIQPITLMHKIRITGSVEKKLWGDKDRISQVLINLLNNAIKYSPDETEILVTVQDEGRCARVSIRDFGIGVPDEHHEKIFDLFYRVSHQQGQTFPGLGMGLHIANEIIKRHDGNITIRSGLDRGAEFSFTLPYPAPLISPLSPQREKEDWQKGPSGIQYF